MHNISSLCSVLNVLYHLAYRVLTTEGNWDTIKSFCKLNTENMTTTFLLCNFHWHWCLVYKSEIGHSLYACLCSIGSNLYHNTEKHYIPPLLWMIDNKSVPLKVFVNSVCILKVQLSLHLFPSALNYLVIISNSSL